MEEKKATQKLMSRCSGVALVGGAFPPYTLSSESELRNLTRKGGEDGKRELYDINTISLRKTHPLNTRGLMANYLENRVFILKNGEDTCADDRNAWN